MATSSKVMNAQRAYYTKTRIKTASQDAGFPGTCLREHIPLKQGLRPSEVKGLIDFTDSESIFH